MIDLDPKLLLDRLAADVPEPLHAHMMIVGSLAAAYHHRRRLTKQVVATKDADVIVHPAGAVVECRAIAERLFEAGWRRTAQCHPSASPEPASALRAIRLHPRTSDAYFVELLGVPDPTQREAKAWVPCELADGWYGVPCFRYMALLASDRRRSHVAIEYASPPLMALANLLAHPELGVDRMSGLIGGREILRSAKDLGRVLALAHLAGADEVESWPAIWSRALEAHFPAEKSELARRAGDGLRALVADAAAFEEAWFTTSVGLLGGRDVTPDQLRATAARVVAFAIEPLARA